MMSDIGTEKFVQGQLDITRSDIFELVVHILPLAIKQVWMGDKQWTQTLALCGMAVNEARRRTDTVSEITGTLPTHPPVNIRCVFFTKDDIEKNRENTFHRLEKIILF